MGWKSDKGGNHFNGKKKIRSSEPSTEVNVEIDNNSDDFAEDIRKHQVFDESVRDYINESYSNGASPESILDSFKKYIEACVGKVNWD